MMTPEQIAEIWRCVDATTGSTVTPREVHRLLNHFDAREMVIDDLRQKLNTSEAEVKRLMQPNFFWSDSSDYAHEDITEAIDGAELGEIVELRAFHELPTIYVLAEEGGYRVFDSQEAAAAWKNTQPPR